MTQPAPAPAPNPHDVVLRTRIVEALRAVELSAGIRSRVPYSAFADAVLAAVAPCRHTVDEEPTP